MDLCAKGTENADPPVSDLIPEPFNHNGLVVGDSAGGLHLFVEEQQQVGGGQLVKAVTATQPFHRLGSVSPGNFSNEGSHGSPQFKWAAGAVAVPERHFARLAGGRGNDDSLMGDVLNPPGAGAKEKRFPRTRFIDHLFIEFANPCPVWQEHAIQTAVGDGAAAGHGQPLRPRPTSDDAFHPIPDNAGPKLGKLIRRVPTGQQIKGCGEGFVGEFGVVGRASHQGQEVIHRPVFQGAGGHNLLGQDIKRVPGVVGLLYQAVVHAVHHHRSLDQISPVLGEDLCSTWRSDLVTGPAHPLQTPADRSGRLNLDHQVNRPHINAKLQR